MTGGGIEAHCPCRVGRDYSPASAQVLNDQLTGDLSPTHDPVIARAGDTYYVFGTGHNDRLIETRTFRDIKHWTVSKPLFTALPEKRAWRRAAARRRRSG